VGTLCQLACCYALCSSAVGAGKPDAALTAAERQTRRRYQEQALDALRQPSTSTSPTSVRHRGPRL
jgi:hypothetical protein